MKVQVDHSILYPVNVAPPAEVTARATKAKHKLEFFTQLSEQSKVRAELAHHEKQYKLGRTSVLDSLMPREVMDPHVFSTARTAPSFAAGMVWPNKKDDGLYSGMVVSPQDVGDLLFRFEHLGWSAQAMHGLLTIMVAADDKIDSDKFNPRPRKLLSKMSVSDWTFEKITKQVEVRASAEHIINQMNDAQGIPVHLHFVHVRTPSNPYNQRMMFVFPESNEEVKIWRHVFNGEDFKPKDYSSSSSNSSESSASSMQSRDSLPGYHSSAVWQQNG